jgi:uncharacterized protein (UPF0303 family)
VYIGDALAFELDAPYEVDDFFGEISHFVGLMEAGATESPVMPLESSIRCARIIDKIRERFTVTPHALEVLAEQEAKLRYPAGTSFGAIEALELGSTIASFAEDYDLGYVIDITRETDGYTLFRWGADGKRQANYDYSAGKRAASLRLGHCSLWGWTEAQLNGTESELFSQGDMPVAGAFPIWVGDERVATLAVSGLHEGLDHELLVRGLSEVLGVIVPDYPCVTV